MQRKIEPLGSSQELEPKSMDELEPVAEQLAGLALHLLAPPTQLEVEGQLSGTPPLFVGAGSMIWDSLRSSTVRAASCAVKLDPSHTPPASDSTTGADLAATVSSAHDTPVISNVKHATMKSALRIFLLLALCTRTD
ncbi:MAG: hypothetical protein V3T72_12765 [Thermoanaerobaculia bacterium]